MMKRAAKTLGPFVEPSVPQTLGGNPHVGEPVDVPMVMLGAAQDPAPPALPEPAPFFRFSARPRPAQPESPSLSPSTSVLGSDGDGGGEMVALGADHRAFAPGSTDREAGMGTRTGSPVPSVLDPARGSDSDESHRPRRPGLHRGSTQNSLGDSGPLPTAQDLVNARQALSDAEARSGANSFDTLLAQSLVKDIERRLAAASGGALAPSEVSSRAASNRGLWGGDSSLSLPGDDSATASLHGSS